YTQFSQLVGTPLYMSPEQAGESGGDVETRSAISSLGVLLDEIMAGSPPFCRTEVEKAGMVEELRGMLDEEPGRARQSRGRREGRGGGGRAARGRPRGWGAGEVEEGGGGRAGRGGEEGGGEAPQPPLRVGQRLRPGRAALPGRRTGGGVSTVGGVSIAEVR